MLKGPYEIIWEDHSSMSLNLWRSQEQLAKYASKPHLVKSYGYIIVNGKNYIVISSHFNAENNSFGGDFKILKSAIHSKKKLVYK